MINFIASLASIAAIGMKPVLGGMAVYCSLDSKPDDEAFKGFKSFSFYKDCGDKCTCSAFELMCL